MKNYWLIILAGMEGRSILCKFYITFNTSIEYILQKKENKFIFIIIKNLITLVILIIKLTL